MAQQIEARRIAITSTGPLSGKSTLAKYLVREFGFIRADHSRSLVEDFVRDYNAYNPNVSSNLTVEDVYADKECWRPQLQAFGYRMGYNDEYGARKFIERTLDRAGATPDTDVVYDPFRGELQGSVLKSMGFVLVQLHIPEDLRRERAASLGMPYDKIIESMDRHPKLERGIKEPDVWLMANMPVPKIAQVLIRDMEVRRMLRERQG